MSETVRYKGKLKEVNKVNNCSLEELCELIRREKFKHNEIPSYCDNYQEWLQDEFYDTYYIKEDKLYNIEYELLEYEDAFFAANESSDGDIEFHVMYYTGGGGLHDALDEALERIIK